MKSLFTFVACLLHFWGTQSCGSQYCADLLMISENDEQEWQLIYTKRFHAAEPPSIEVLESLSTTLLRLPPIGKNLRIHQIAESIKARIHSWYEFSLKNRLPKNDCLQTLQNLIYGKLALHQPIAMDTLEALFVALNEINPKDFPNIVTEVLAFQERLSSYGDTHLFDGTDKFKLRQIFMFGEEALEFGLHNVRVDQEYLVRRKKGCFDHFSHTFFLNAISHWASRSRSANHVFAVDFAIQYSKNIRKVGPNKGLVPVSLNLPRPIADALVKYSGLPQRERNPDLLKEVQQQLEYWEYSNF